MWNSNPETPRIIKLVPKWVKLYNQGKNTVEISNIYGVAPKTVYNRLKRNGVRIRSRSEVKMGAMNPMWKGDNVSYGALHGWVKNHFPMPKTCMNCHKAKPYDLANISPSYNPETYTRELSNWKWLCRSCHMIEDHRISNLKQYATPPLP